MTFRYSVQIETTTGIMMPKLPEHTVQVLNSQLMSYNFWGLTGEYCNLNVWGRQILINLHFSSFLSSLGGPVLWSYNTLNLLNVYICLVGKVAVYFFLMLAVTWWAWIKARLSNTDFEDRHTGLYSWKSSTTQSS